MHESPGVTCPIPFAEGLLGELQVEALIDALCADGCPNCGKALVKEGRFKCYCSKYDVGLEFVPPRGGQN